jgi:toxin FitB
VLGYHNLKPEQKSALEDLFSSLSVLYPSPDIFQMAVTLRQQKRISLGDSLIAATALVNELTLATHNESDFDWIDSLKLIDPLKD